MNLSVILNDLQIKVSKIMKITILYTLLTILLLIISTIQISIGSRFWYIIFNSSGAIYEGCKFNICIGDKNNHIKEKEYAGNLNYSNLELPNYLIEKWGYKNCELFIDNKIRGGRLKICFDNDLVKSIEWRYNVFHI